MQCAQLFFIFILFCFLFLTHSHFTIIQLNSATHLVESYHPHSDRVWQVLIKYETAESKANFEKSVAAGELDAAWPPREAFYEDCKKALRKAFPAARRL